MRLIISCFLCAVKHLLLRQVNIPSTERRIWKLVVYGLLMARNSRPCLPVNCVCYVMFQFSSEQRSNKNTHGLLDDFDG